jgi:hypothetical protein
MCLFKFITSFSWEYHSWSLPTCPVFFCYSAYQVHTYYYFLGNCLCLSSELGLLAPVFCIFSSHLFLPLCFLLGGYHFYSCYFLFLSVSEKIVVGNFVKLHRQVRKLLLLLFIFIVLGAELKTSHLLGKNCTTWATTLARKLCLTIFAWL